MIRGTAPLNGPILTCKVDSLIETVPGPGRFWYRSLQEFTKDDLIGLEQSGIPEVRSGALANIWLDSSSRASRIAKVSRQPWRGGRRLVESVATETKSSIALFAEHPRRNRSRCALFQGP
jgi:hypothetical protein